MEVTAREITEYEADDIDGDGRGKMPEFLSLGELCLTSGPKKLRKLAKFLNYCAEQMEQGSEQDHYHFNGNINDRPQIVVLNKKIMKRIKREREEIAAIHATVDKS